MADHIWVNLPGGREIDIKNPNFSELKIEDIANALAKINRFGGHTSYPYSVAQHSVNIVQLVAPHFRRAAFAHDWSEALVNDLISPIKNECPDFQAIEHPVQVGLFEAFNIPIRDMDEIHRADKFLGNLEKRHFFDGDEFTMGIDFTEKSWTKARDEFMEMYHHLWGPIMSPKINLDVINIRKAVIGGSRL